MRTYQDLQKVVNDPKKLVDFLLAAIADHKLSDDYKYAKLGRDYGRQENTTILEYEKYLHKLSGETIPDPFSANHKLPSNFYDRFNTQENQYLLGNGVSFTNNNIKNKLGTKKKAFDTQIQKLGKLALTQARSFGFWNLDYF